MRRGSYLGGSTLVRGNWFGRTKEEPPKVYKPVKSRRFKKSFYGPRTPTK